MDSWIEVLSKFFDKAPVFPAVTLSVLTVIILQQFGLLNDLRDPNSWLAMVGIVACWMVLVKWIQNAWAKWGSGLTTSVVRWKNRSAEIEKLKILTEDQKNLLAYLKTKQMRQFQAYSRDDTIVGLERMGLLREHEQTAPYSSRFEVPAHIWDVVRELNGKEKQGLPKEHPWVIASRKGRI